ncbi:adenylate/guanylate cyclase domain-containing protein [Pseudovibrio exalbescens]|uniref:adenylate/guanylate cyclase domain-containing protein n=1 Tax=Pseudovibrio exalbescens TaxID=197461 RepID=UPI002365EF36|nr:adenylate/guanylate cyclase domain-containing protein [Pseudovibrio exalbescens]MDD7911390.1 adenylate/guanylate cyclase domain-containing protein [Pseudovibrio exalbescens]
MPDATNHKTQSERHWRLPITWVLGGGFGLLLLAVAGTMLLFMTWTAERQTSRMMAEIGELMLERSLEVVDEFFSQEETVGLIIADIMTDRELMKAPEGLQQHLARILARQTNIGRISYTYPDGRTIVVRLSEDGSENYVKLGKPLSVPEQAQHGTKIWAPPYFDSELNETYLRLIVYLKPEFETALARITVDYPVRDLEHLLDRMVWRDGQKPFILFQKDKVLASTEPIFDDIAHTVLHPVPKLSDMTGTPLPRIWDRSGRQQMLRVDFGAHVDQSLEQHMLFIYAPLNRHQNIPLLVGSYMSAAEFGQPLTNLNRMVMVAVAVLIVGLVALVFFGRALGRPIRALAEKAMDIRHLDLEGKPPLPRSHLRELDETNASFNAAIGALEAFSRYVPRDLVRVLLERDFRGLKNTELRTMTIMFSDIAGFTTVASRLSAEETTALLNAHFEEISKLITSTGGTIDKYLGDGVMAFWGAPEEMKDHAERAVEAVKLIERELLARAGGPEPCDKLRVRIGLHTGTVVVGNIGSSERMDYTVIGDAVNVASRLQELGKTVEANAKVLALASEETVKHLSEAERGDLVGSFELRGRDEPVNVFRLV